MSELSEETTILVVEDDKRINHLFMKKLTSAGHTCVAAFSIQEAIETISESGPPALIILDLELGDGFGTDVLKYLNANDHNETKVIVVSANAFASHIPLENYTVDRILLKPVSPRGLSALVNEVLAT